MSKSKIPLKVKEPLFDYLSPDVNYKIINGDAYKELNKFEQNKFDLIITSPPYNLGKEYETKKTIEEYLVTQELIIEQLVRVLSEKGSIC